VAGLVNAGIDVEATRAYLQTHAPELLGMFEEIVTKAIAEE
jgi:hypothetical protein